MTQEERIDGLRTELRRAWKDIDEMNEWQEMDTAPKDKPILLYIEGSVIEAEWNPIGYQGTDIGDWEPAELSSHGCGCCGCINEEPVAWMPLPEAPKTAAKKVDVIEQGWVER